MRTVKRMLHFCFVLMVLGSFEIIMSVTKGDESHDLFGLVRDVFALGTSHS